MKYNSIPGVPNFVSEEFVQKKSNYCICIPIINEGQRIHDELKRARKYKIDAIADIIICDGGSIDGSTDNTLLEALGVNTLLIKKGPGKQGAQLRMGIWWALERGYDFIQGSRFIKGGKAINTPFLRYLSVRLLHAPVISLTAHHHFTDTTNAFRGHSRNYLTNPKVQPLRDIFNTYELLAYLSTRASQIGLRVCEVPVTRAYPIKGKVPTKISFLKGNSELLKILFSNMLGKYNPQK